MSSKLSLGLVVFETTDACNQRCKFCYNHWKADGDVSADAPDFRLARRTLRTLLSQAEVAQISMSGGEPLLMPRLHDLIWTARWAGSAVNVLTNGTRMTPDTLAILHDLGVQHIQIPILADNAALHDSITGLEGSWQKCTDTARQVAEMREAWLTPVFILSRLNRDNIAPTLALYHNLGCRIAMFNRFNIGGLGIHHAAELTLTNAELQEAFAVASRSATELNMMLHNGVCSPMCVLDPSKYPHIIFSHCNTDIKNRPLTINYRGEVRFCNHSPRILGNIHQKPLAEILDATHIGNFYGGKPDHCASCKLWEVCRGGCRAASEQLYGTFNRVDPIVEQGDAE